MTETQGERPLGLPAGSVAWLRGLVVAFAIALVLLFVAAARLRVPFKYVNGDPGMLATVIHLHDGLPLYASPNVDFTPFLYTPVFYYAALAMTHVMGLNYAALRMVSVLATLGCFGVIYALVFAEVRSKYAAMAAVGCFAACYPEVLQCFDVGRVDMLYLVFVLCAIYATRWMNPMVAALLWVCAFQTKQGVLPVAVLFLCHDWQRPRRVWLGLGTFAALMAASIGWMTHVSKGWYLYYVFQTTGGFGWDKHLVPRYLPSDLLGVYGLAIVLIVAALLIAPPVWRSRATAFYAMGTLGMVVFTGYIRAHRGAASNAVMPAYLWIAILFGISLVRLEAAIRAHAGQYADVLTAVLLLAASAQLSMHFYSPREFAVFLSSAGARDEFEQEIRSIPGDVLVFEQPEDGIFAGKPMHAQMDAIGTVLDSRDRKDGDRLMAEYAALIHSRAYGAVVLEFPLEHYQMRARNWVPRDFELWYPLKVEAIGSDAIGIEKAPSWIYLPCNELDVARRLDSKVDAGGCGPTAR